MAFYQNGRWYTDFKHGLHRETKPTDITANTPTAKARAKKIQAERKALFKAQAAEVEKLNVRNKRGKIVDQPICDAFSAYWENHAQHAKGAKNIFRELAYAEAFFGPEMLISHIDAEALIRLREKRRRDASKRTKIPTPISNRAVNITCEAVKFAMAWLRKNGRTVCEIDWSVVLLQVEDRVTEFKPSHEAAVLNEFRPDYLPCLLFMLECGPRKAQAVGLRWTDIDWKAGSITLKKQKKRGSRRSPKPHLIPISKEVEALLLAQIAPETGDPYHSEFVWTYVAERTRTEVKSGRKIVAGERYPITYEGLSSYWVRFKAKHGFRDVRIHDLRHAAGTRIYRQSKNPLATRDLLGHSDLSMTERYMHPTQDDLREAMNRRTTKAAEPA
ncbi:tyrosine-type recombinase/integrase [Methylobacterium longum]|uniref:Site-specific integrase n=1 Tax=Methylobacterium longum TaxID=767694 RepID=A0ABT8AST2_9HYPH|nr:site-specific integrase [Methylobacterium longum]MDN3572399.1 site-specific integrase [Methylobacterium longum]GJE09460.1 Tyrosine recombinase XerC [Methylobacterium longum]